MFESGEWIGFGDSGSISPIGLKVEVEVRYERIYCRGLLTSMYGANLAHDI
jgi:hypothetical protein